MRRIAGQSLRVYLRWLAYGRWKAKRGIVTYKEEMLAFIVAHKSASNKIRKARGREEKKYAGWEGREERRSKAKPRDEFIHGRRGVGGRAGV